jgi:hypothetical protein
MFLEKASIHRLAEEFCLSTETIKKIVYRAGNGEAR